MGRGGRGRQGGYYDETSGYTSYNEGRGFILGRMRGRVGGRDVLGVVAGRQKGAI